MMDDSSRGPRPLSRGQVYYYLRSRLKRDREELTAWSHSLRTPKERPEVFGMGLVTISSVCVRDCIFCGYRASGSGEGRFRLSRSQILEAAGSAKNAGVKRLILKSGDDPSMTSGLVSEVIQEITKNLGMTVSMAMGERNPSDYSRWREAGADMYWLRHETCDPHLYRRIRPFMFWVDRIRHLDEIKDSGFSLATGIMLGMPNQGYESVLEDLFLLSDQRIKAIVIEPYKPPPDSPGYRLVQMPENLIVDSGMDTMIKLIAICRIMNPRALITLTNAHQKSYQALDRPELLNAGANSVILDFTPEEYCEFESLSPFTGFPVQDPEDVPELREKLASQGFELALDQPAAYHVSVAGS